MILPARSSQVELRARQAGRFSAKRSFVLGVAGEEPVDRFLG